jgi:hypothetical protein
LSGAMNNTNVIEVKSKYQWVVKNAHLRDIQNVNVIFYLWPRINYLYRSLIEVLKVIQGLNFILAIAIG